MEFELLRIAQGTHGTFGVLKQDDIPFAVTLELPWRDNERETSCIPNGEYLCKRILSPKFGDTFEVQDVPGRTHILFHRGNLTKDTQGCILVAEQFESVYEKPGIASSGKGFGEFMYRLLNMREFQISIQWRT